MLDIAELSIDNIEYFYKFIPESLLSLAADSSVVYYGILDDDTAIGSIVIHTTIPAAELMWINIAEDYRGSGRGSIALSSLFVLLYQQGFTDMYINLGFELPYTVTRLLSGYAFDYSELPSSTCVTTLGALRANKHINSGSSKCISLEEATMSVLSDLYKQIIDTSNDFIPIPVKKDGCNSSASAVYMENGKAMGILILKEENEHRYRIPYMYSYSTNPLAPIEMIRFSVAAGRNYPDDTELVFDMVSAELTEFATRLFECEPMHVRQGHLDLTYLEKYFNRAELITMTLDEF